MLEELRDVINTLELEEAWHNCVHIACSCFRERDVMITEALMLFIVLLHTSITMYV